MLGLLPSFPREIFLNGEVLLRLCPTQECLADVRFSRNLFRGVGSLPKFILGLGLILLDLCLAAPSVT